MSSLCFLEAGDQRTAIKNTTEVNEEGYNQSDVV